MIDSGNMDMVSHANWRAPKYVGAAYKAPKFYCFSKSEILVIQQWPSLRCWRKTMDGAWRSWIPSGFGLETLPYGYSSKRQNRRYREQLQSFWENCPENVSAQLQQYPTSHFDLAWLFARAGNAALDLSVSNPALAHTLSRCRWFRDDLRGQNWSRILRRITRQKQRDILAWLRAPYHAEATVGVIKKVPHSSLENVNVIPALMETLNNPLARKWLSHLPRINFGVIRLLEQSVFPYATWNLLQEVANDVKQDVEAPDRQILVDVCQMLSFLDMGEPSPIRSRDSLKELHDSLVEDLIKKQERFKSGPFPRPPLSGTEAIIPITDEESLRQESCQMSNCVMAYSSSVRAGCSYIYHASTGEGEATIELRKDPSGQWALAQAEGPQHGECQDALMRTVQEWLVEQGARTSINERFQQPPLMHVEDILEPQLIEDIPF